MPAPRTGDLSASLAVLGLLAERLDTAAGVKIRLERRFPDAHWTRSAVDNTLPSLVKQGLIRLVKQGYKPGLSSYEATAEGAARVRRWVRESPAVPPVLRDGLLGKLSFSAREDLLPLVESIRQEVKANKQRYADVHRRFRQEARQFGGGRSVGGEADWDATVGGILVEYEAKLWGSKVKELQELLEGLEVLLEELPASRALREAG